MEEALKDSGFDTIHEYRKDNKNVTLYILQGNFEITVLLPGTFGGRFQATKTACISSSAKGRVEL